MYYFYTLIGSRKCVMKIEYKFVLRPRLERRLYIILLSGVLARLFIKIDTPNYFLLIKVIYYIKYKINFCVQTIIQIEYFAAFTNLGTKGYH